MASKKQNKANDKPGELPKQIIVRTDLTYEELMKKALSTPLPKKKKVK